MVIKIILILLGVYFIIKLISRSLFSFFFGEIAKKTNEQVRQQQEDISHRKKRKKEGEVSVNYQPKSRKNFAKEDGDYIDFEEVK